jgi:hypothetical protein
MSYEQYANNAQSTTTGSINNSSNPVTFSVTSATGFPTAGNFRIIVDSEIMLVTSVSGASFTASRAQEGTSIASHSSGATVTHVLTAASLEQAFADRNLVGTYASLPAAGVAGRSYRTTDSGYTMIDNGSSWSYAWDGYTVTQPSTSWTWLHQGTATQDTTKGTTRLQNLTSNGSAFGWNGLYRAVPGSTPYTIQWGFNLTMPYGSAVLSWGGPAIFDSTPTKMIGFRIGNSSGAMQISLEYYTNGTSLNTTQLGQNVTCLCGQPIFITLTDDGTNRNWYWSPSAFYNPILLYQDSRTTFLTAANYGMSVTPYDVASVLEVFHCTGP